MLCKTEHDQDNTGIVAVDTGMPPGLALIDGGFRCTGIFNNHVYITILIFMLNLYMGSG